MPQKAIDTVNVNRIWSCKKKEKKTKQQQKNEVKKKNTTRWMSRKNTQIIPDRTTLTNYYLLFVSSWMPSSSSLSGVRARAQFGIWTVVSREHHRKYRDEFIQWNSISIASIVGECVNARMITGVDVVVVVVVGCCCRQIWRRRDAVNKLI